MRQYEKRPEQEQGKKCHLCYNLGCPENVLPQSFENNRKKYVPVKKTKKEKQQRKLKHSVASVNVNIFT